MSVPLLNLACSVVLADAAASNVCVRMRLLCSLCRLLAGVTIAQGGVLPNIHAVLVKNKAGKAKTGEAAEEDE